MSIGEIVVLSAIVVVFAIFGGALFAVAWYCNRTNPQHAGDATYPHNAHFLTDD